MAQRSGTGVAVAESKWEQGWRERVEAWRRSGQKQAEYCRSHGIAESSLSRWKLELARRDQARAMAAQGPAMSAGEGGRDAELGWRQVSWPPAAAVPTEGESGLEVVLPRGWSIRLGPRFEAEALKRLLAVLGSVPC